MLAGAGDDPLGAEAFAGLVGRAEGVAATAFRAVIAVEPVLPGQLARVGNTELLCVFILEVDGRRLSNRTQGAKVDVEGAEQHVEMLAERQQVEEADQDQEVRPPAGPVEPGEQAWALADHGAAEALFDKAEAGGLVLAETNLKGGHQHVGQHQAADEAEDQDALGTKRQPLRLGHRAAVDREQHGGQNQAAEGVAQQQIERAERLVPSQQRQFPGGGRGEAVQDEVARVEEQDHEAPEDEEVHQPGLEIAMQQAGLAKDVYQHARQPRADIAAHVDGLGGLQHGQAGHDRAGKEAETNQQQDAVNGHVHNAEHQLSRVSRGRGVLGEL